MLSSFSSVTFYLKKRGHKDNKEKYMEINFVKKNDRRSIKNGTSSVTGVIIWVV